MAEPLTTFQELFDRTAQTARSIVNSGREAMPMVIARAGNGKLLMLPHRCWGNANERDALFAKLRAVFKDAEVQHYVMVNEAWALRSTTAAEAKDALAAASERRIKDHPKRIEVLMVVGAHRDGTKRTARAEITGSGSTRQCAEFDDLGTVDSGALELLE